MKQHYGCPIKATSMSLPANGKSSRSGISPSDQNASPPLRDMLPGVTRKSLDYSTTRNSKKMAPSLARPRTTRHLKSPTPSQGLAANSSLSWKKCAAGAPNSWESRPTFPAAAPSQARRLNHFGTLPNTRTFDSICIELRYTRIESFPTFLTFRWRRSWQPHRTETYREKLRSSQAAPPHRPRHRDPFAKQGARVVISGRPRSGRKRSDRVS